jgi:hypothetical protein
MRPSPTTRIHRQKPVTTRIDRHHIQHHPNRTRRNTTTPHNTQLQLPTSTQHPTTTLQTINRRLPHPRIQQTPRRQRHHTIRTSRPCRASDRRECGEEQSDNRRRDGCRLAIEAALRHDWPH